jgi:lipopolysaccharide biosynthesis regulator YciM
MRKVRVISLLLAVASTSSILCATTVVTGRSAKVMVQKAASAAEQLAIASRLSLQIARTPAPRKFDLFAEAWSNLSLVRKAWPTDKKAVVRSGIMQADLAVEFNQWTKAVDVLLEVLPAADKADTEPQVEQKLGQAYEQVGNLAESEKHLLAAERAMHRVHPNRVQSEDILISLGTYYSRQNNPHEAIKRFREAAGLSGQDVVNRMQFQLSVAKEAARLGKDAAVPELRILDDLVSEAHQTRLSPADATLVNRIAQHAQRIHDSLH